MLTHPHSYIYHFRNNGGKIRRPGWWQEEGQKLERYMNGKYDVTTRNTNSPKNMDKIIGHYEIIKEYKITKVVEAGIYKGRSTVELTYLVDEVIGIEIYQKWVDETERRMKENSRTNYKTISS